ncbi:hypothetical protein [Sphingosinicella terrae]|uniref:hypothetical protein n=1 Tax=Sphingosinicella terrae TaxID=2172047 RepID=UPI000E0DBBB4|nr:hypothetical protein [Sphingosinicella terrae]
MSMLVVPGALLLSLAADGAAAATGFEPLAAVGAATEAADGAAAPPLHCTGDRRWCARIDRAEARLVLTERAGEDAGAGRSWALPLPEDGIDDHEVWPHLRIEADGAVLAGVLRRRGTGFAGGSESSAELVLVRLPADRSALSEAGELPVSGGADIRACFDADDRRARLGACSDEYEFTASIAAEPVDGAPAELRLETRARTFPGRRSRTEDSLAGPPLRRGDLVWAEDAECSYRRRFTFDAASGRYRPDEALPECSNYFGF